MDTIPDQVEYVAQGKPCRWMGAGVNSISRGRSVCIKVRRSSDWSASGETIDTSSVNTSSEDETLTREIRIEVPHPKQIEFLRRMAPADRVAGALRMTRLLRTIATTRIRSAHPDWSDAQISVALRERLHARRR